MRTNQKILNSETVFHIKQVVELEFNYWINDNGTSQAVNNLVRALRDDMPLSNEQYDLLGITRNMLLNPQQGVMKAFHIHLDPEQE